MSNRRKRTANILILSLIQDMKCLDQIIDNSLDDIERTKIESWLYPHKKFIDTRTEHSEQYEYQQLSYENCLERLIDSSSGSRLYIILSVVNNRMDTAQHGRNIYHPQNVTLGRCVQMFWESFCIDQDQPKRKISSDVSETNFVMNKWVQTEFDNSDKCNSCTQAADFMKDITEYIATNFETSLTKTHRESINENIFNMTKYGITMKLTNSIKQDYHNLTQELKNSKHENQNLSEKLLNFKCDITKKEKMIEQIMEDKHRCNEEMATNLVELISSESYIITLEQEKKNLQKNESETADLRHQVKIIQELQQDKQKKKEIQISNYEKDLHVKKCEITSLKADFNSLKSKFDHLYGRNSKMCQMNFKLEQNLKNVVCSIGDLNNMTDNINQIAIHITGDITQLNERIKLLQECVHQQTNSIDKMCTKHNASIDAYKEAKKFGTEDRIAEFQGNPILDLAKQIEENEITIDKLQSQNHKFRIIIEAYQKKT